MQTANCKFSSKGYLTVVNYKFFSEVKKNSVIIVDSKALILKFLHQMGFTSFSLDYAMNPIAENELDILR